MAKAIILIIIWFLLSAVNAIAIDDLKCGDQRRKCMEYCEGIIRAVKSRHVLNWYLACKDGCTFTFDYCVGHRGEWIELGGEVKKDEDVVRRQIRTRSEGQ